MIRRKFGYLVAYFAAVGVIGFTLVRFNGFGFIPIDSEPDVTSSIRIGVVGKPVPKGGGTYRVGDPYVIAGRTYTPREEPNYRAEGVASWYGESFHGRLTANGEIFDMHALSAAHPTLPLRYARVTNLENNISMVVRLNDRGPYRDERLIDLSVKAAQLLGFHERGLTRVRVEYIGPAELEGSDNDKLAATLRRDDPSEIDIVGGTERYQVLGLRGIATEPYPGIDAFGADSKRFGIRAEIRETIEERFPKVIFD